MYKCRDSISTVLYTVPVPVLFDYNNNLGQPSVPVQYTHPLMLCNHKTNLLALLTNFASLTCPTGPQVGGIVYRETPRVPVTTTSAAGE